MNTMPKASVRKDGRYQMALPRKRGESRRFVTGSTLEKCEENYRRALGLPVVKLRPGSISEFVVTHYSPWLDSRGLEKDTISRYNQAWQKIIGPSIGHMRFSELTATIVQECLNAPTYGASSRQTARLVLAQIIDLAIAERQRDAVMARALVSMAKLPTVVKKRRVEMGDKAQRLYEAARRLGHWTEGFIFAAMTLGCRKGELCAIKLTDIDTTRGTLTIRRQRNHTMGERERLKGRAAGQERTVGLPAPILERLLGYFRPGAIYLVTRPDGSPPPTNHFERYLAPVEAEAGVKMTPHDLRSAAICSLIDLGVDRQAIKDLVGHGSDEMIQWYMDERAERTRGALERLVDR